MVASFVAVASAASAINGDIVNRTRRANVEY